MENVQDTLNLTPKTAAFHTLGCRLNFSETGTIEGEFAHRGYKIVPFGQDADVTFINTCTVTDGADSTCRNLIRKAQKFSPEGKVIVAGCYAQMEAEKIKQMQGVDLILGTSEKFKVFDYLEEEEKQLVRVDKSNEFWGAQTSVEDNHTRAFLKIQDGCNYICSFCIIPFARGRSRTISIKDARESAINLIDQGFKEIVLTGVNIGEYERTSGERLSDLVAKLLELNGLSRLRLSSVEVNTFTDDLIDVLKSSDKVMPHFHIPLQSGDDQILAAMKRKYSVRDYEKTMMKLLDAFPYAGFGADVIAGFPGETEKQFQNTYDLMKELPFSHFHVFPYSKRQKTVAAKMENHIQHGVKKDRVKNLMELGEKKLAEFSEGQLGSTTEVLFEKRDKDGLYTGYSENFLKVRVESSVELKNTILPIFLENFENNQLLGQIIS